MKKIKVTERLKGGEVVSRTTEVELENRLQANALVLRVLTEAGADDLNEEESEEEPFSVREKSMIDETWANMSVAPMSLDRPYDPELD